MTFPSEWWDSQQDQPTPDDPDQGREAPDPLEDDERWSKNFEDTKDIHESDLEGV